MKTLITLLSLILFISGFGQDAEFSRLSAKEKMKIAKKEAREAKLDPVYKELMDEAHAYFSEHNYELALDRYEKARLKRPYNVYPKVKIVDVELAMGDKKEPKHEVEQPKESPEQKIPDPIVENPEKEQKQRVDKMMEEELKKSDSMIKKDIPDSPPEVKESKQVVIEKPTEELKVLSKKDFQEELGRTYPDGMTEEIFKEGNKVVTRRIVVKNGVGDEYRKVVHPWGGKFYFKNGDSITQRMWDLESNP